MASRVFLSGVRIRSAIAPLPERVNSIALYIGELLRLEVRFLCICMPGGNLALPRSNLVNVPCHVVWLGHIFHFES